MCRIRSRIWSSKRVDFSGGVPGFMAWFITGYLSSIFADNPSCKPLSGKSDVQNIEQGSVYRAGFAPYITLNSMETSSPREDRLDVWYDGSAICVIAIGPHGDPLDLAEHEVEALIQKLQRCLSESRGAPSENVIPSNAQLRFLLDEVCTSYGICAASRNGPRFLAAAARGESAFLQELFAAEGMSDADSGSVRREVGQLVHAAFRRWEEGANAA